MRHILPAVFILTLSACAKKPLPSGAGLTADYKPHHVAGVWTDAGGGTYEFDKKGKAISVTDSDGERFPVLGTNPTDSGQVQWVYRVPSTGYVVTHVVNRVSADSFEATWSNVNATGDELFTRVR